MRGLYRLSQSTHDEPPSRDALRLDGLAGTMQYAVGGLAQGTMPGRFIIAAVMSVVAPGLVQAQQRVEQWLRPGAQVALAALGGAGRGFRTGAVIGLVVTGLVLLFEGDSCDGCVFTAGMAAGVLSVMGTLGLTVVGGVAGAVSPGEIWHDVNIQGLRR